MINIKHVSVDLEKGLGIIKIEADDIEGAMKKASTACHKQKHRYNKGYPCGRNARCKDAQAGIIHEKWQDAPGISISYYFIKTKDEFEIHSLIGNLEEVSKRFTARGQLIFMNLWQQDVIGGITESSSFPF